MTKLPNGIIVGPDRPACLLKVRRPYEDEDTWTPAALAAMQDAFAKAMQAAHPELC